MSYKARRRATQTEVAWLSRIHEQIAASRLKARLTASCSADFDTCLHPRRRTLNAVWRTRNSLAEICGQYAEKNAEGLCPTVDCSGLDRDSLDQVAAGWLQRADSLRGDIQNDGHYFAKAVRGDRSLPR